jgi:hypothetical protein
MRKYQKKDGETWRKGEREKEFENLRIKITITI